VLRETIVIETKNESLLKILMKGSKTQQLAKSQLKIQSIKTAP
jgi:hypothetical protein